MKLRNWSIALLALGLIFFIVFLFPLKADIVNGGSNFLGESGFKKLLRWKPSSDYVPGEIALGKVFQEDHSWTKKLTNGRTRVLITTGDVMLGRAVNQKTAQKGDFIWPFQNTADFLKSADLTFINLESPIVENCPVKIDGMTFCGNTRHVEGLLFSGIDVANLANNHIGNYGTEGLNTTSNFLESVGILTTGNLKPAYKESGGMVFSFLGYNDIPPKFEGVSWVDEERVEREIKEAKANSDIVIVAFHWGEEYRRFPTKRQKKLARLAIDLGASVVVGNHPHAIQPIEVYKGGLIVYSHGNFVFDQMWSEGTKEGIVGRFVFYDEKLVDAEFFPIRIENYGQPYLLTDQRKDEILEELEKDSRILAEGE
ncbi:MAG: CapA family protein [Candidatus Blackburnbacteria bacterium]|nr:CapA family protein [Candidatus Blackburnbacteria bacterium]